MKRVKRATGLSKHEKQANHDYEFAKRLLFEFGEVTKTFVFHSPNGTVEMPVEWNDNTGRACMLAQARLMMIAIDAEAISYMTEAWTRDIRPLPGESEEEQRARAAAIAPADAEDRVDTLHTCLFYFDDAGEMQTLVRMGEIQRNARGKPSAVTQPEFLQEVSKSEGRMEGLIYDTFAEEITLEERKLAAQYLAFLKEQGQQTMMH